MSASFEATASAATVSQGESSPESRIPVSAARDNGDSRRAPRPSSASDSQSADCQQPGKERPAYLIKWSRFEEQLSNAFAELFCSEHFADVTLACEGGDVLKAHKIILAMSSPFFRRIFIDTPCKHPIIVLKEFSAAVMRNVLQYLYLGKVVLSEHEISGFMDAADFFGICGIIPDQYSCDIFATSIPESEQKRADDKDEQPEPEKFSKNSENDESNEACDSEAMMQDDERTIISHSPVIKYHGIKARWNRRYSNTSIPGVPNAPSANVKEHKRSASAGEVESVPRSSELPVRDNSKVVSLEQDESQSQPLSDVEIISGDDDRFEEPPTRVQEMEARQRRIIQRTYPKVYSSTARNLEDNTDAQFDEWKNPGHLQNTYIPPTSSATSSTQRTSRLPPYILGAKDFSHPLQVNVASPKQAPLYSVSSVSAGVIDPVKSKSHPEFTMSSPHSLQPQLRTMLRPEPETEFPATSSVMSLPSTNDNDERSSLRYRQLSSGSSTATSPTAAYGSHEYSPRPHFSLLSTQGWPFQDSHHRHRHHFEESARSSIERRFRSDSLDRGIGAFSSASHLRGMATHSASELSHQYALGYVPQLRSPSSATGTGVTRPKTKAIRSSQVPQSSRYTAQEVDTMVDQVANYPGNIVPCTLCQKFVKRERLRAHIHECHLLSGEKIICPHCGIALKSKGSFRVHIWRHKRGALPTRSTMSDFDAGRPPSPPHAPGPASH